MKLLNLTGFLATLAVIAGAIFKILHLQGGVFFMTLGLALFFFYLAAKFYFKMKA
jgi:hypothetical protein